MATTTSTSQDLLLANLKDGDSVAVITMLGSLCPITLGHVQCFVEARNVILGNSEANVPRPARLEKFAECLGLVALNGDGHVGAKLRAKGQKPLDIKERSHLVKLATDEYPWLCYDEHCEIRALSRRWPSLRFVEIDMNGADDVVKYQKWACTGPENRMITMGRPGFTETVKEGMQDFKIDPNDGYCFLGPELPDISSTAARDASARGDVDSLLTMLHPAVADWLLQRDGHKQPKLGKP